MKSRRAGLPSRFHHCTCRTSEVLLGFFGPQFHHLWNRKCDFTLGTLVWRARCKASACSPLQVSGIRWGTNKKSILELLLFSRPLFYSVEHCLWGKTKKKQRLPVFTVPGDRPNRKTSCVRVLGGPSGNLKYTFFSPSSRSEAVWWRWWKGRTLDSPPLMSTPKTGLTAEQT